VVVAVGLTACVPPFGCRVYVLPSLPVTVTWVALTADTVKTDELPDGIEVGFAVMLTVGGGFEVTVKVAFAEVVPPVPVAAAV
jgi:hypothetical protein